MSHYSFIFLKNISVHPSFDAFFANSNTQDALSKVENVLSGAVYTPAADVVLRFATVDLKSVKATIYGKDPYPQQGVATGRSFEVNGVTSWFDTDVNSSLKNIVKSMHKSYMGYDVGSPIAIVRADIESGTFPILPPNQAFAYWESKGVLFLNTAFTCEVGGIKQAGSHLALWKPFFKLLMAYIAQENPTIKYFLWGDARKHAEPLKKLGIPSENIYLGKHPCTNGDNGGYQNGTKFLNCPCFKDTMDVIPWVVFPE
ncbi:uracil-DNA glycosylase [Brevibacillus sp. NPDC058079]|uniref:uracil-DNA glycosylase n=1 Tax=Brevibacillus sp. NPDC058079 TaxID=3346330 RepID=UPI0036DFE851